MRQYSLQPFFLLCFFITVISSCKHKEKSYITPEIKKLELKGLVQVADQTIPLTGGKITVSQPGSPIDGLSLEVPENSFNSEERFTISWSEINSHNISPYFHPITPAICIANNSGFANEYMELKIPVKVPAGQFAMPFMYHPGSGRLEAMQITASDNDFIIVTTTRFCAADESNKIAGLFSRMVERVTTAFDGGKGVDVNLSQIIVSSIDEAELTEEHISPFRPKTDDFQFPNYGSVVASGGHCAGQSLAMMWYYSEKKLKNHDPDLFGLYDNKTPQIWQDDTLAYKLCSLMQKDWDWSPVNSELYAWQYSSNEVRVLYAFTYALMVTNEPQLIYIAQTIKEKSAHAMVVYGVSKGNLLVADPNFPGDLTRHIEFDHYNNVYLPYFSGKNAGTLGTQYSIIRYVAKSAVKSWDHATGYWHQFVGGSIGVGAFPEYSITAMMPDISYIPFTDGFEVWDPANLLTFRIICDNNYGGLIAFDEKGELKKPNPYTPEVVQLRNAEGEALVGINVRSKDNEWAGFKWVKVKMGKNGNKGSTTYNTHGNLQIISFTVNGLPAAIDSAHLVAEETGMVSIEAWGPRIEYGIYAYERTVSVHSSNCTGRGTFQLDNGGNNGLYYWEQHVYSPEEGNSGTITITSWTPSEFQGEFNFTGKDLTGNNKTISAKFTGKLR